MERYIHYSWETHNASEELTEIYSIIGNDPAHIPQVKRHFRIISEMAVLKLIKYGV